MLDALEEASIVAGEVLSPQQALDETLPLPPTPIELSETPGSYRRPAPLLGEHTEAILKSLGYSKAEIAALRTEEVI